MFHNTTNSLPFYTFSYDSCIADFLNVFVCCMEGLGQHCNILPVVIIKATGTLLLVCQQLLWLSITCCKWCSPTWRKQLVFPEASISSTCFVSCITNTKPLSFSHMPSPPPQLTIKMDCLFCPWLPLPDKIHFVHRSCDVDLY